ncbi:hypothetical protein [Neobacillus massiliamazoniensis]|uniref:Uncharacterized protein n=1 Tax=Neobacillus massiliamazoniensis TaxID=1499688 RepID=A0A0U1NVG7_9BACI|nr:hypothetical protein [Neobacillus massiliamazoniensis]CRK82029.1 hypothetical protein BN000_01950 [Neobacillus massiliamazoniensis]
MKKLFLVFMLMFSLVLPSFASASGFSGHSSSTSSHSRTSSYSNSGSYHSGYKSPSSSVKRTPSNSYQTNGYNQPSRGGSFWSHAAAFGAGTFVGHMFHPFGGHYYGPSGYYGSYGFSFLGLLVDILMIVIIISIIKRIFTRRRY